MALYAPVDGKVSDLTLNAYEISLKEVSGRCCWICFSHHKMNMGCAQMSKALAIISEFTIKIADI